MADTSPPRRQSAVQGTALTLMAEALAVPIGFVIVVTLTRALGPEGYGRYSVAATVVNTIEWMLVALLSRPTVRFVAQATRWQPVAAMAFRVYAGAGLAVCAGLWALADPIAAGLGDARLAFPLRLFALELPFFAAATACRNVLTGLASFRQFAMAGAGRWFGLLVFILLFVHLGWGIPGAILANVAGAALAWGLAQAFVGRATWGSTDFPIRELFGLAVPVFLLMLSARLFYPVGLLALKAFGGTAADAGYYGAAQTLLIIAGIVSMSVSPILISTVSARRQAGDLARAGKVAETALMLGLWMFPFTAIISGASHEVVALLFGASFDPAAPVLALLIVGATALTLISIASALLIALGRPWPAVVLTLPLLPLALVAHAVVVPRFMAVGAAAVTVLTSLVGAGVCLLVVCRVWPLRFPTAALARSLAVSAAAYVLAAIWPATGVWLIVKSAVLSLGVVLAAVWLHEFSRRDLDWLYPSGGGGAAAAPAD